MSPNCDGLPGDELSHREGEDFQPLDVSGVVEGKGVTKGKGGLHVSPPCGRSFWDELSHREGKDKFQPLDVSGVVGQKVLLRENEASM